MSNILITGSTGQLGSEIKEISSQYINYNFFFTDSVTLDITDGNKVEQFIVKNNIKIIINCAAYTAVDKAEIEFESCNQTNHLAVANFARIAKDKKIKLVHISTDYIFEGNHYKPYIETDIPNPKSVYGKTKLDGEKALIEINPSNSIIIRTSWVYSIFGNNFLTTMLRLGNEREELNVISDQVGTPTYARDLATIIIKILPQIENDDVEIFHYSNEGVCSWYDFSKAIFENKSLKVNSINTALYPTVAKRPFYSVLDKSKIKTKFNIEIPYWKNSLQECLNNLKLINGSSKNY